MVDNKRNMQKYITIILVGLLFVSALMLGFAPLLMEDSYSWIRHTTSESAGQMVEGAWFARTGFVIYGITIIMIAFFGFGLMLLRKLPFLAFGISMFAVAIFSHRPWIDGIEYSATEDTLHSIASASVGMSFIACVMVISFTRKKKNIWNVVFDVFTIISSIVISLLMAYLVSYEGILQRIMFLISYIWYGHVLFDIVSPRI